MGKISDKMNQMDKRARIAIIVAALLALMAISFYCGTLVSSLGRRGGMMGSGPGGQFGGTGGTGTTNTAAKKATGASYIMGEILSIDDSSLTVKLMNGGSKIVIFGTSTEVGKFTTGAFSDLSAGQSVMINGNATADGSITAKSIQIRPTTGLGAEAAPQPGGQAPANQ